VKLQSSGVLAAMDYLGGQSVPLRRE
jgi:alanine-glyoxylate transaminase / serine-glyoxylate transaminase / serine-pyruvate transaminase